MLIAIVTCEKPRRGAVRNYEDHEISGWKRRRLSLPSITICTEHVLICCFSLLLQKLGILCCYVGTDDQRKTILSEVERLSRSRTSKNSLNTMAAQVSKLHRMSSLWSFAAGDKNFRGWRHWSETGPRQRTH